MKKFDERAEAAAERQGKRGAPPPAVRRAVQRALATGHRKLEDDLSSLDVLLNFADNPDATSVQAPPEVGSHGNDVAVEFFGRVADDIRKVRDAVSAVDFDPDDKQKFRIALKETAAAWDLRAQALAESDPEATGAVLAVAWEHEQKVAKYKRDLKPYFAGPGEDES